MKKCSDYLIYIKKGNLYICISIFLQALFSSYNMHRPRHYRYVLMMFQSCRRLSNILIALALSGMNDEIRFKSIGNARPISYAILCLLVMLSSYDATIHRIHTWLFILVLSSIEEYLDMKR